MSGTVIPIVFCISDEYAPQLAVTILSILKNSKGRAIFEFNILHSSLSVESQKKILKLKKFYRESIYNFIDLSGRTEGFDNFMSPRLYYTYISTETYYRFFIPELLARHKKVLYLDADILVLDDLQLLFEEDISDYYIAAVQDSWSEKTIREGIKTEVYPDLTFEEYFKKKLKMKELRYFNAGVQLINIDKINSEKKCKELWQFVQEESPLEYLDQDASNAVFNGRVKFIDPGWNALNGFYDRNLDIRLMHFVGRLKPWLTNENNEYFFLKKWWEYYTMTPFFSENTDGDRMCTILNTTPKVKCKPLQISIKKIVKYFLPYGFVRLYQKLKE